ncbi:NMUR1 family protein [Megaselia abdita]
MIYPHDNITEQLYEKITINNGSKTSLPMEEPAVNWSIPFPNDTLYNTSTDYHEILLERQKDLYGPKRDSLAIVIPVTIMYTLIFISGVIGNISTCIVIKNNRSMHTATNYYLFSLAISDFFLLLSGVPQEMYYIWSKWPYVFGEAFCIVRGLLAETAANATVLTITAFSVERYFAICHPFLAHALSKLSRATKIILLIWFFSFLAALPQAAQFGVITVMDVERCDVVRVIIDHSFELATFLFFITPMSIILVLYLLIGLKLHQTNLMRSTTANGNILYCPSATSQHNSSLRSKTQQGTKRVLKMLVAVVIAFFLCWAPFHAQRLVYIYSIDKIHSNPVMVSVYHIMTYISGVLYYLSTCINPLLYNLMSNKFREAFKSILFRRHFTSSTYSPRRQTSRYKNTISCHGPSECELHSKNLIIRAVLNEKKVTSQLLHGST